MAAIRVEHATKEYPHGVRAVADLSLAVSDGEFLVLMGPSGCGKTTTLRLIAGLEKLTSGNVYLDAQAVDRWPIYKRDVAMVFQRPALYPHLSVRKNLEFGLSMQSHRAGSISDGRALADASGSASLHEIASMLRLEDVLDRWPRELSGGQQQRVALGRAILRRPRALLLDEPLSNLDAGLRQEMRRELHLLHRRLRATMVYVTHDQAEAMTLGDRIALLDKGILQQVGPPETLYQQPVNRLVAASLGSSAMNFLDGRLVGDGSMMTFEADESRLAVPPPRAAQWVTFRGRPLTLGVRTENLLLGDAIQYDEGLTMQVAFVEYHGDHALVGLRRANWNATARVSVQEVSLLPKSREGETRVRVDLAKAHLFDGVSGMALCHPESG
jgi:multiple sugar transport system ATP-binding protein